MTTQRAPGASVDIGFKFRNASEDLASGSISIGAGKHGGVKLSAESITINIGGSLGAGPLQAAFNPANNMEAGAGPPINIVQPADATSVNVQKLENREKQEN